MKQILIKVLFVLFGMFIGMEVFAQINMSEACIYVNPAEDPNAYIRSCLVIIFKGDKALKIIEEYSRMEARLKNNPYYYENEKFAEREFDKELFTYDASLSNSEKYVYKRYQPGKSPAHPFDIGYPSRYYYMAFSKDASFFTWWLEEDGERSLFVDRVRVPKPEFKNLNSDILE